MDELKSDVESLFSTITEILPEEFLWDDDRVLMDWRTYIEKYELTFSKTFEDKFLQMFKSYGMSENHPENYAEKCLEHFLKFTKLQ